MSKESLKNVGIAYRWLIAYYKDIVHFCNQVEQVFLDEYPEYESLSGKAIEAVASKSWRLPRQWLPCYHSQFFVTAAEGKADIELAQVSMLGVSIDHHDPDNPERDEPEIYLQRFGPVLREDLPSAKSRINYEWAVAKGEEERDGWHHGQFREISYSYRTLPLSSIETLEDIGPKLVTPLVEHDRHMQPKGI
jgi:hypothetical protein